MTVRRLPITLLGLAILAAAPPASGQSASPGAAPPPPGSGAMPQPDIYERTGGPPVTGPHQLPAFAVSGIDATQAGGMTMVKVRGVTTTAGWREPTLVPLVRGTPSDGVLDVVLVAEPPPETMAATGFSLVEAVLLIEPNHPYRGVRVRSATNVLAVAALPGRADVAPPAEDCRTCVGRPLAAGAGDGDAIGRDRLPAGTRVLGPTDPFPDVSPNPNRLTLLVGDDGKVIEAMWQ